MNVATVKQSWTLQIIEVELQDIKGNKLFASVEFCSSFWHLVVHPGSFRSFGIICPQVMLSSKRVFQGLIKAGSDLQSSTEPLFSGLRDYMKRHMDGFNLHADTEEELLDLIDLLLGICQTYSHVVSVKKSVMFKRK